MFAVTVALPVSDPTRAALRDPAVFDSVARLFPACRAWLALDHEAVGDVQVMAGLDNRWTALVDERGPVVTGLVNVGDSLTHTNPTLGQGAALALLAAQRVATTYDGAAGIRARLPRVGRAGPQALVRPPGRRSTAATRRSSPARSIRTRSRLRSTTRRGRSSPRRRARSRIRWSCGRALRSAISVLTPDQAFGTPEVREHLGRWLERHPEFPSMPPGPSRADWEALTGDPRRRRSCREDVGQVVVQCGRRDRRAAEAHVSVGPDEVGRRAANPVRLPEGVRVVAQDRKVDVGRQQPRRRSPRRTRRPASGPARAPWPPASRNRSARPPRSWRRRRRSGCARCPG